MFAQIGPSALQTSTIEAARFLPPAECRERMLAADAIVAHAGMGTILSALELGKPLVIMPRLAAFGEHRNDHQLATAKRFAALGRVARRASTSMSSRRSSTRSSACRRPSASAPTPRAS